MDKSIIFLNIFSSKIFFIFRFVSKVEFFCLLILFYIFVLVVGTVEQKNFGLNFVQDVYFNSMLIFFFDKVPIPGGKLLLILMCLSLFFRLIFDKWKKKKAGTIILHLGVLFLLFGAFLSNQLKIEGTIILKENGYSNFFLRSDLYDFEFLNKNTQKKYNEKIFINDKNKIISLDNFNINLHKFVSNSVLLKRQKFLSSSESNGVSRFFLINDFPSFVEQEENRIFLHFSIKTIFFEKEILILEDDFLNYEINDFKINIFKKYEALPFNLYLSKFDKIMYEGTKKVKNYISNLIIENNEGLIWKTKIEMNKPLRIDEYTLYQTSYLEGNDRSTVLTIVKDTWNFYPYIATCIIFTGFVIHLVLFLRKIWMRHE